MNFKKIRSAIALEIGDRALQKFPTPIINEFINNLQYEICNPRFKLRFMKRYGALNIQAPYTTGTVAVTQGSKNVFGTDADWTGAPMSPVNTGTVTATQNSEVIEGASTTFLSDVKPGYRFHISTIPGYLTPNCLVKEVISDTKLILTTKYAGETVTSESYYTFKPCWLSIDGDSTEYEIIRFCDDAEIRLSTEYAGTTDAEASYTIYQKWYNFNDNFRDIILVKQSDLSGVLEHLEDLDLRAKVSDFSSQSSTTTYYVIDKQFKRTSFYDVLSQYTHMEYEYWAYPYKMTADESLPDIPEYWHELLIRGTVVRCMNINGDKRLEKYLPRFTSMYRDFVTREGSLENYNPQIDYYTGREGL